MWHDSAGEEDIPAPIAASASHTMVDPDQGGDDKAMMVDDAWRHRLKAARKRIKGMTQKRLGDLLSKSQSTIQAWESPGGTEPSWSDWFALAGALQVTVTSIPFGDDNLAPVKREHYSGYERLVLERVIAYTATALASSEVDLSPGAAARVYLAVYDMVVGLAPTNDLDAARIIAKRILAGMVQTNLSHIPAFASNERSL